MRLNPYAEGRGLRGGRVANKAIRLGMLAMLALSPLLATHTPVASAQEADVPSGRVIVVLSDQVQLAETTELAEEVDASVTFGTVLNGFAADLTPAEAAELADDPNVVGIYPDLPIELAEQITVSLGVRRIGAPSSNVDLEQGLPPAVNATVAVIDSGVSLSHPNLNVVAGFDAWTAAEPTSGVTNCGALTTEQQAIYEGNGASTWGSTSNASHGSQVAGVIAAEGRDGVVGVAPGAGIVAVKVYDNSGSNFTSKTICGLAWIHANKAALGIDVVNMSLVWPTIAGACDADPNHQAVCNVVNGGLPIVAANGNLGSSGPMNVYPELIAVSAFNDWDGRPGGLATLRPSGCNSSQGHDTDDEFSTYNQTGGSDYMAPGSCIWSTTVTGYGFNTGTSFAAPHVTGAIALFAASNPSPSDAAARVYLNSNSVPATDPAGLVGAGDGSPVLHLGPSPITGSINPTAAAPSAKVDYTVNGFPANATVTITWEKAAGGTIAMGTVFANPNGEASGQLTVPDTAPGGPGQRIVFSSGDYTKSFLFETRPRARFQVATAVPGETVLSNGRGFAANDTLDVLWKNELGQFVSIGQVITTNSNGNYTNVPITVPEWAPPGANTMRLEGVLNQNTSSLVIISPGVQIAPIRTTVNNWITFDLSNFPPNAVVQITWTRPAGSTIDIVTDPVTVTDEAGNATGQFRVPATPGGAGQIITFSTGAVSETVEFEVAPRIKSNTNPGVRGGTIDFSLRGFARQENFIVRWQNPATGGWVTVGSGTTSNTGSANVNITVPLFAPDGNNKVRAESPSFNQQTNVVNISGGAPLDPSEVGPTPTPAPEPTATPDPIPTTVDSSALPFEAPLTIAQITDDAQQGNLRTNLTDGQLVTGWSAAPSIERNDARVVIELGSLHQVSGLAWLTETGGCGELTNVEYSIDGQNWLPVDPYLIPGNIADPMVWRYFAVGVEATHLRITIGQAEPGQNPLGCIAEVAVWGTQVVIEPPTPEPTPTDVVPTPEPTVAPAEETPPADDAAADQTG